MNNKESQFNLGIVSRLEKSRDLFTLPKSYNLSNIQIVNWDTTLWKKIDPVALRNEAQTEGITVNSIWAGYSGKVVWNFMEGPSTIGIVPRETRKKRVNELLNAARFASDFGVKAIVTHLGFLPENCKDPLYIETVDTVKNIASELSSLNLDFWFETGQETPVTLLRLIEDVAMDNIGINLDPANLILYGKANPVDSLEVFGKYVRSLHIKDGFYPTTGKELGKEANPGKGMVDFHSLFNKLKNLDFSGDLIIERELEGGNENKDILSTITFIKGIIQNI